MSTGDAVRSQTWLPAADLSNWVRGKGRQLIAATSVLETITSGNSAVYRFRVAPSVTGLRRVWRVAATGTGRFRAPAGSGTWHDMANATASLTAGIVSNISYIEDAASASSTEYEASIEIDANGGGSVIVYSISLEEAPRLVLGLDSTDLGVDINTEVSREAIVADDNKSLYGVSKVFTDETNIRRSSLFHWAVNESTATAPSTAAGPDPIFALDVPILVPKLHSGDTTGNAKWRVNVRSSGATVSGTVSVLNNRTGVTTSILCTPGTTWTWFPTTAGAPTTFSVDCEDVASTDGRRSAASPAWCDLTFTFTRTGTAGTFYVAGISVFHTT